MNIEAVKQQTLANFAARCGSLASLIRVYSNPTEEIRDAAQRRKSVKLFARGQGMLSSGGGAKARLEENYLYDTRRFASGAQTAGEYVFFQSAVGAPGVNNGFAAAVGANPATVMSDIETNMEVAGQIPNSKDYVLTQIGISFNADIAVADAQLLLEIGALRFEKGGGAYVLKHGPGRFWPGGTGLGGFAGATAITAGNGSADIRAVRRLAVARILQAKDTFAYKYVIPRAVRNLDNSTAISLAGNCLMCIWLWGGQQQSIMT